MTNQPQCSQVNILYDFERGREIVALYRLGVPPQPVGVAQAQKRAAPLLRAASHDVLRLSLEEDGVLPWCGKNVIYRC